ncbi:MAG: hypothetical protein IJU98_03790 [Synergistaceae bacterium]|nr:hypothetical protein [Synergistaceae bacterium]
MNRQTKNSVFLNLFTRREYQLNLYEELFPEDTSITEDDLELVTLENVLTIHPYNDLGLLARGRLIVLAEAQSTWSVNVIFRLAEYYFDSAMKCAGREDAGGEAKSGGRHDRSVHRGGLSGKIFGGTQSGG